MGTNVQQLYMQHIRPLSPEDRHRLLQLIASDLSRQDNEVRAKRSIMELHGLGADIWQGIDAQEYVNELRKEWDHRP